MLSTTKRSISSQIFDVTKRSISMGVTTAGATLASRAFSSMFNSKGTKKPAEAPLKNAAAAGATVALSNQLSGCASLALNNATKTHGVLNNMAAAAASAALLFRFTPQPTKRKLALAPIHVGLSSMLFTDEPLHSLLPTQINQKYAEFKDTCFNPGTKRTN